MRKCKIYTVYTVCLQMNGAVSEVNKKFISHLTRAKRTPSAAATVQVSHALPAVRSLVLTAGLVSNMASQQEKAFCVLRFEVSRSVITVQREFRARSFLNRARQLYCCTVITDLDTSKRSTQKAFSCCYTILETGPAVSMRSELLVAHGKLGELPLLKVYVVPV